jgi:hypothetical protein
MLTLFTTPVVYLTLNGLSRPRTSTVSHAYDLVRRVNTGREAANSR